MPIELKMPALSPTMEEGTLAKWLVKEGVNSVSLNPDTVVDTWIRLAGASDAPEAASNGAAVAAAGAA